MVSNLCYWAVRYLVGSYCKEIAIDCVSTEGGFGFARGVRVFLTEFFFFFFNFNQINVKGRGKKKILQKNFFF